MVTNTLEFISDEDATMRGKMGRLENSAFFPLLTCRQIPPYPTPGFLLLPSLEWVQQRCWSQLIPAYETPLLNV